MRLVGPRRVVRGRVKRDVRPGRATFEEKCELIAWASACAERVLPLFESVRPDDHRPRQALELVRAWARGDVHFAEVRRSALEVHAAARETDDLRARAAARAAGHAAATAHSGRHGGGAAYYELRAVDPESVEEERKWQRERLPEGLWRFAEIRGSLP